MMKKAASFPLKPVGKLFVHIFTNGNTRTTDSQQKMRRSGQANIFYRWHCAKTAQAWLQNMTQHQTAPMQLSEATYVKGKMLKGWAYQRLLFMSCAEPVNFGQSNERMTNHCLFHKTCV